MVLVAFAMPTSFKFWPFQSFNKSPENSPSLINWKLVETKLAWGVIFLLGGGFALSDACEKVSQPCFESLLTLAYTKTTHATQTC